VGILTDSPNAALEVLGQTRLIQGTNYTSENYAYGALNIIAGNAPATTITMVTTSNLQPALNRWAFKIRSLAEGDFLDL